MDLSSGLGKHRCTPVLIRTPLILVVGKCQSAFSLTHSSFMDVVLLNKQVTGAFRKPLQQQQLQEGRNNYQGEEERPVGVLERERPKRRKDILLSFAPGKEDTLGRISNSNPSKSKFAIKSISTALVQCNLSTCFSPVPFS